MTQSPAHQSTNSPTSQSTNPPIPQSTNLPIPQLTNPFVGPRTFTEKEQRFFFGREREARDLTARIVSERLLLFYAQSGAGKSSLLNARVIPRLRDEERFQVLPVSRVSGELPAGVAQVDNIYAFNLMASLDQSGEHPRRLAHVTLSDFLARLARATAVDAEGERSTRWVYKPEIDVERPAEGAAQPAANSPRFALVIDQFEEVITSHPGRWREREGFFRQLNQALLDDPSLWVVLSLREDYVASLDPYAELLFNRLRARFYMERMGVAAALDAVRRPAELAGRPFALGAAEQLVDNLRQVRVAGQEATVPGQYVEPVQLQVVCFQMWENLGKGEEGKEGKAGQAAEEITLEDLAVAGDVDRALTQFYEETLVTALADSGSAGVSERQVRTWFDEELITEAGTRGLVHQGESRTGSPPNDLPNDVVRALQRRFLVRDEARGAGTWIELVHDRFVEPIRASNAAWFVQHLSALQRQAGLWNEQGRSDGLLLAGQALDDAEHWAVAHEEEMELHEQDFLVACRKAREQAKRERRQSQRNRVLALVAGAVAIVAIAAAIWGWTSSVEATRQKKIAEETTQQAVEAKQAADASAAEARRQEEIANVLRQDALLAAAQTQSFVLANQSQDPSSIEDSLLLARAATKAYPSNLPPNAALLDALDNSYRLDDGTMTAYVPRERLDFVADGPWQSVAFSQDGRVLALSDARGGITLWDNARGEPIGGRLTAHGEYPVYALAFDPTGPRLISATGDRNNPTAARHDLVLWNLADPAAPTHQVLARNRPAIWSAAWRPDGQQVAVANQDGAVELWDLTGSEPISRTLPGQHDDWAFSVAYDPTGSRLASAGKDGVIILWSELASSNPMSQTLTDHTAWINVVAFSPDGTQLASGSDDGTLRLWDLSQDPPSSVELDNHFDLGIEVWDLAFTSDGTHLAAGWGDNLVRVYDLAQRGAVPWQLAGHGGEVSNVAFDPAAPLRLVSLGESDYEPIAWDISRRSEFASVQPLSLPEGTSVRTISPDGSWLAVVDENGAVYMGETGLGSPQFLLYTDSIATAVAVSKDGSQLALAGCESGLEEAQVFDPASSESSKPSEPALTATPGPTNCKLTIYSTASGTPIQTIEINQPITALAFHPERVNDLTAGLKSGEVQTYDLSTSTSDNLAPGMPEIADLAFNSDGSQLAALGRDGTVVVWNWTNRELVSEYSPDDSQQGAQFDAIAFVLGDAWLALAASAPQPQLELRERGTWTLVDRFNLDLSPAADLALDAGGQTLLAASPGGSLVRWPMDQASWLELACARAGRNLSYDAWRKAFPTADLDNPKEALICDGPLDISFTEALVAEADKAIDDCRSNSLADGLALLEQASRDERLKLDPTQSAAKMLSEQALEYLRQPLRTNDDQARACLDLAAGLAAFDPQRAFQAAASLTQAERLLVDQQLTDLGPAVDALEVALEGSQQWPDTWLKDETLRLLPEAYFLACQQGDEAACDSATAVIDFMETGDAVPGQLDTGSGPSLYFQGQRGQAVTIAMTADNNAFDTLLSLEGPAGVSTSDDDSGPDYSSLIANYLLQVDGIYRVLPTAYGGGSGGSYRVSFDVNVPRSLALDRAETSTKSQGSLWQFQGEAGQAVAIALDSADPLSDPTLRLIGPDLTELRADYDSGGNRNALILATLPNDGPYFVSAEGLDGSAAYTLRLFEPQPLPWDEPQASTGVSNTLWAFEGARSQVIDLQIATTGSAPTPQVTLRNTNGDLLALGEARVTAYVLPAGDRYIVQVSPGDSLGPYTLTLTSLAAPALVMDQAVTSTSQANPIWTFSGQPGQIVDITLKSARLTYDPRLALLDAGGSEIASDDNGGGDLNARIAAFILPAEGQYFVKALPPGSPVSYTLVISTVTPLGIQPGEAVTSTLRQDTLWAFDGQAGQPLNASVQSATDGAPSLTLQTATGETLRNSDGNTIAGFFPPQTGRYFLRVGGLDQKTPFTLMLQDVQPAPIAFGRLEKSNTQTRELWRFSGRAGQVVAIDMTGWVSGGFDPYLTLLGSDGRSLVESDDISSDNYNARIATFILPQSGDYFIRAGRSGSQDPYTLLLQEVQAPEISFGETQSSNTQTDELWRFSGQAGQVVDVDLTGASDSGFDPYLTLYGSDGSVLAVNDNISSKDLNARIAAFMLPATGDFFIRSGPPGYAAPYQLSLTARRPTSAVIGTSVQTQESAVYALPVPRPGFVAIAVDPAADLSLAAPGGAVLASRAPAILTRLDATGVYTLGVSFPTDGQPRRVSITPIAGASQPISVTGTTSGELRTGNTDLWSLPGVAQAVRVTAVGESFTPLMELWAPGGARLAVSNEDGVLTGLLPVAGDALLSLRGPTIQASGPYTLTVEPIAAVSGPQACTSGSDASAYLPVSKGSLVLLGRQRPVNGVDGWIVDMTPYVGRPARVTALAGADWVGCPAVYVDIDQGQHTWRVRDLLVLE